MNDTLQREDTVHPCNGDIRGSARRDMSPPGPGERSSPLPLAPALEEYKAGGASLISVLQRAQEIYGWLPQDVLRHISEATGTKFAKIMGVATFYTQFRLQPAGKYVIMLCKGTACHVNGAEGISAAVADELGITEGTTADGLFTLNEVACLGCCSLSPVMMINGETYGSLTPEKARAVLRAVRGTLPEVPSPKEQKP